MKNIYLASPRGYCAGVHRAINILNGALEKYKAPIFVNHEIIHNKIIVEYYKKKGIVFDDNLDNIPENGIMIFSAHGISPKYIQEVKNKGIKYIDASCPLVIKVHTEAKKYLSMGYKIIYIGQKKHQEALGILGEDFENIFIVENKTDIDELFTKYENNKFALLTQTTLSVSDKDELEKYIFSKFKTIEKPKASDICYATTNRQNAVRQMLEKKDIDLLIIVGSKNSSNSNKLKNIGLDLGIKSILIDEFKDLDINILDGIENIGISSGASVSYELVTDLIKNLENKGANFIEEIKTVEEKIDFGFDLELK